MSIRLLQSIFLAGVLSPVDGSTLTLPGALEADLVSQGKAVWVVRPSPSRDSGVAVTAQTDAISGRTRLLFGGSQIALESLSALTPPKTLALCGHSLLSLAMSTPNRRLTGTAYSWANGVVTLTVPTHGVTVGAAVTGDAQWNGGAAWSAMRVTGTATDANTITYPLATNPGAATAETLYFNCHAHPGSVSIASISYGGTTATITLTSALQLDTFNPGQLRFSLSECVGAGAAPISALNAIANACPLTCPAGNQMTFYIAGGDPGVALVSGKLSFLEQYQGTQNSWPIALINALGAPFTVSHNLGCGAVKAKAIIGQATYLASLPAASKPGFALISGAVNTLAASETTAADDLIAAADICYNSGITPILCDEVPALGLNTAPLTALYDKFIRNIGDLARSRGYLLLTGFGVTLKPDATTAIPSQYTDTTFPPITPPTIDGTHYARYGAYSAAIALAASPGGQILQQLRKELPIAVGGTAGNLLSNPMFGARTGGVSAGASSGNVPSGWQVNMLGVQTVINTVINRALPSLWRANTTYAIGDCVIPISYNSAVAYVATVAGVTAGAEPVFPAGLNQTVADGGVTWRCISRRALDGKPGCWLQCYMPPPTALAISAATRANPCVITLGAATGLAANKRGLISGVVGMTQLNNKIWAVSAASTTPNLLRDDTNGNVDSTGFGVWSSGGVFLPMSTIQITPTGALAKGANWVTGDRLQLMCEFQHDDFFYGRVLTASVSWPGASTFGEMSASSYSCCVNTAKDQILAMQPFIAPLELTVAAQTLNPIFSIEMITGTFRIARPTLVNLSTA